MTPTTTIYISRIKSAGLQMGPVILIHPKYKDDIGLYQHELTHVTQWWVVSLVSALVIGLLAYATLGAEYIAEKYGLKITPGAALELLT